MARRPRTPKPESVNVPTPTNINWPAYAVERRAVADLRPYERNARTHTPQQINQLVAAMREWGWTIPILVDESDMIIAGHGRLEAAKKMGVTEAPVIVARGWTEQQKRAYSVADNRLGDNSTWNAANLRMEISDLKLEGFNLDLLAFSAPELRRLEAGFSPNLQPGAAGGLVSAGDVAGAQARLDGAFTAAGKQDIIYVDCPHCGQKIGINREDLK